MPITDQHGPKHATEIFDVYGYTNTVWFKTEVLIAVGEKQLVSIFFTFHYSLFIFHCLFGVWFNAEALIAVGEK